MEKPTFTRANLSNIRVIMPIMHVPMVEFRCQAATGWIPILKYLLSGTSGHPWPCPIVPSIKYCSASRGPASRGAFPVLKASVHACREPGCVLSWGMRLYSGQTGDEILPAHGYHDGREDWHGLFLGLVLFRLVVLGWWPLLFSQEWWDLIWYGVLGSLAIW
jgi:hypothetical protein